MTLGDWQVFGMYLGAPIAAYGLCRLATVDLGRFSVPSLFFWAYFILAYVGVWPLYTQWDEYSRSLGVTDPAVLRQLVVLSATGLLGVTCGFVFMRILIGKNPVVVFAVPRTAWPRERLGLFALVGCCLIVLFIYVAQVGHLALLDALAGDPGTAALSRSEMGNAFTGDYWRYRLFFRVLLDFAVVAFVVDGWLTRRLSTAVVAICGFVGAVFSAVMAIEKGPLVLLLAMLGLAGVFIRGRRYWHRLLVIGGLIAVAVVTGLYVTFMGTTSMSEALTHLTDRVVLGQIRPAYFYLDLFPGRLPYLMGTTLPNPAGLLPFEPFNLTQTVEQFMWPGQQTSGIVGSAPTVFWGEMYANFGPAGVVVSSVLVGAGLLLIGFTLDRLSPSPITCAATVSLSMHYMMLSSTSLSNYLVDTTAVALVAVTWLLLRFGRPRR